LRDPEAKLRNDPIQVAVFGARDDSRPACLDRAALASFALQGARKPQWKAPSSQKLPFSCTNRLRASQIAALMLVDFETVDIR